MKAIIKYSYTDGNNPRQWRTSTTVNLLAGFDSSPWIKWYVYAFIIAGGLDGLTEDKVTSISITSVHLDSADDDTMKPMKNLPAVEKINQTVSVFIERKFIDLPINTKFLGRTRYEDWRWHIKTGNSTAIIMETNESYYPNNDKLVLTRDFKQVSLKIKQSPSKKARKMATKTKAPAKKATKKTSAKKGTDKKAAADKVPTKKSIVAKYLKAGKKPAEIVELMAKDGVTTTLASVRAFIQSINNGE